ncbi:LOW QUALITY PROTEIN: uncharacterized protein C20orf96 homolog [Tyto alba]|uniref:LOW QUALITY PROTEIN: uncharacterized protein C20orf96 homolog n=1 Tax=Tyto alba TaxID=56313 RepID=UPI001C66E22B|nr:LOW QUALITY PROTEIN: uncharacterized protein C20orf96 homolog [Tyto alba]
METGPGPGHGDAGAWAEMDAQGPVPTVGEEFKRTDYSKWQKTKAEGRKSPARRLTLPPLADEDKKKKGDNKKPVAFMPGKKPLLPSETSPSQEKYRSFAQRKLALRKAELAKTLEEIKITTNLTNLKKKAIEELKQRGARLAETNCRLRKDIQRTDDSTARQARSLLQQYEGFQRVKVMVQTFCQNQLDTARAELQEMEKTMEKNLGKLQQQLDEVTSKAEVLREELGVLRTYIDGQFPAEAVQILLLQRSIQSLKKHQQEEIEKTEEMGKAILADLEGKARAEQEAILQKVVEFMLLHQDGLKQMVINNHVLQREILRQKEIIKDLEEEIGELKTSIQTLRQSARDPRELIFADVLLRRPNSPVANYSLSGGSGESPLLLVCCADTGYKNYKA